MRKYQVNRTDEPQLPSKETIAKYKNFTHISHEYDKLVKRPKVPIYKDKKMFLVLLLIALMAFLLSQIGNEEETQGEEQNQPQTEQGTINRE